LYFNSDKELHTVININNLSPIKNPQSLVKKLQGEFGSILRVHPKKLTGEYG